MTAAPAVAAGPVAPRALTLCGAPSTAASPAGAEERWNRRWESGAPAAPADAACRTCWSTARTSGSGNRGQTRIGCHAAGSSWDGSARYRPVAEVISRSSPRTDEALRRWATCGLRIGPVTAGYWGRGRRGAAEQFDAAERPLGHDRSGRRKPKESAWTPAGLVRAWTSRVGGPRRYRSVGASAAPWR